MQKVELCALIGAKKRSRHVLGLSDVHVPCVLERDFYTAALNLKWVTDVTEFNVNGHKLHLFACLRGPLQRRDLLRTKWQGALSSSWLLAR